MLFDKKWPARDNLILSAIIVAIGIVAFGAALLGGRADSALFFVALPVLLAAALALTPARTPHARAATVTTIVLLLTAVVLHEGAICVLLAAPLIFAVVHGVTALIQYGNRDNNRSTFAVLPLPLLLLGGVEGLDQDWRIHPDQSASVTRVVALTPDQVRDRIIAGPQPAGLRELPLVLLGAPTPQHVTGAGLDPGDRWEFGYHSTNHGAGGSIVTKVRERAAGRVDFTIVSDTTITSRWLRWRDASVSWHGTGDGRTAVTVTLDYQRRLDPSWYFGPVQNLLMHSGGDHLLDMLALR